MIEDVLWQYFEGLTAMILDPRKRMFIGYLLTAVIIGVICLCVQRQIRIRQALQLIFDRQLWCGASARLDYQLLLINQSLMIVLAPVLLGQMAVATFVYYSLHELNWAIAGAYDQVPAWLVMPMFTLVLFTVDDFSRYLLHRLLHRVPMLWAFHKIHHSAQTLTPATVYRTHPIEGILFSLRSSCVQGVVLAIFIFPFGAQVDLVSVLGVNVLLFVFNMAGSNLRHSHVALGYPNALENVFMSPAQHQIHHSIAREHVDKNFGAALSLWDWIGGTRVPSLRNQRLHFGLAASAESSQPTIAAAYLRPFAGAFASVRELFNPVPGQQADTSVLGIVGVKSLRGRE